MNKNLNSLLWVCIASLWMSTIAYAAIYKQVDAQGRVTYSNVKIKGAIKLDIETPARESASDTKSSNRESRTKLATPSNFPKVDTQTQNQRDEKRKSILQSELESEKAALADAKAAYDEGAAKPEVYRTQDGKTRRNVPKFDEKMRNLQAEVDAHQRNIELLEKEISSVN